MHFDPNIDTFRTVVKQLEESKKLINKSKPDYSRMAIVLIDNSVEILLFRYLRQAIRSDYEMSWYSQPKFSDCERDGINRYFDKKIKAINKLNIIKNDDASILKIIHSYRNSIYHRGFHNPITINKFAELYFVTASELLKRTYSVEVSIGGCEEEWLKKYGLKIDWINFKKASEVITDYLLSGFDVSLPTIKKVISEDITFRMKEINIIREKILPYLKNNVILDSYLKVAEYFDKNPYLSEGYNKLMHEFLDNQKNLEEEDASKRWRTVKLEEKRRDKEIEKELKTFKQTIKSQLLKKSNTFLEKIKNYNNVAKLLEQYNSINRNLLKVELYLGQLVEEFDRKVEQEIDLIRGK